MKIDAEIGDVFYIPVKIKNNKVDDGCVNVEILNAEGDCWDIQHVDAQLFPLAEELEFSALREEDLFE